MDVKKQRIEIAHFLGYEQGAVGFLERDGTFTEHVNGCSCAIWPKTGDWCFLSDYVNCINSISEAEKKLYDVQLRDYVANLWDVLKLERNSKFWDKENFKNMAALITASAPQRCEALLKTIGKWEE